MKLLITGAKGQLGWELQQVLARGQADIGKLPEIYAGAEIVAVDVDTLDITDRDATLAFVKKVTPAVIFNCAAYTQVDACEEKDAVADKVNGDGVRHLAEAAEAVGAKLVHVSTDYVFDGKGTSPYREDDPTDPATAYGRTKVHGEQAALSVCSRSFVLRTAWLYGPGGPNFVKTMLRLGSSRDTVTVVCDQVGSPTYTEDLAWTMLALAVTDAYGIYHVTGGGQCSWCEFATAIMAKAQNGCTVQPCTSAEYPSKTPRPAYSVLGHGALQAVGLDRMRPWEEALDAYFKRTEEKQ